MKYVDHAGARAPAAPSTRHIWAASAPQDLRWKLKDGSWAVVVMNANGSPGVDADVSVGARTPAVLPAAIGFAVVGFVLVALAGWLINKGSRRRTL